MIYWIDDEEEYLKVINELNELMEKPLEIITLSHCDELNKYALSRGDIVIHDFVGVGNIAEKIDGVKYYCHSGNQDCELPKPMTFHKVIETILK